MMASQLDLDQGGTNRQWTLDWMGPSIGYVWRPLQNVFNIVAAGTYSLDRSTNYVAVNVAAPVTVILPSASFDSSLSITQPGIVQRVPIVIYDIGGFAQNNPINIQPLSGQTIVGLSSIVLSVNYGSYILFPTAGNWNSTS